MDNYKIRVKSGSYLPAISFSDISIKANIDTGTKVKIDISNNQSIIIIVYPDYIDKEIVIYNDKKEIGKELTEKEQDDFNYYCDESNDYCEMCDMDLWFLGEIEQSKEKDNDNIINKD